MQEEVGCSTKITSLYKRGLFFFSFLVSLFSPFPYNRNPPYSVPRTAPRRTARVPPPPRFQFTVAQLRSPGDGTPYHSTAQRPEYCFEFGKWKRKEMGRAGGDRSVSSINKAKAGSYWLSWGLRRGEQRLLLQP